MEISRRSAFAAAGSVLLGLIFPVQSESKSVTCRRWVRINYVPRATTYTFDEQGRVIADHQQGPSTIHYSQYEFGGDGSA